jgi:hypothetical protein
VGEGVEPARMYELKADLDSSGIYLNEEIERYRRLRFGEEATIGG